MRQATADNVVKFLEREVFHVFGVPEYLHSDNGKQFVANMFEAFLEKYGVKHIKTAFYSPQANAAERVNRSVLQILRSYIGSSQRNWDQHLSDAAFALRSVTHSAIGVSPYYAVFGIPMVQHGAAYDVLKKLGSIKDTDCAVELGLEKHQAIRDTIFDELKRAHSLSERFTILGRKILNLKLAS